MIQQEFLCSPVENISFFLERRKRKTISLCVLPDGKILVRAPFAAPINTIYAFIDSKAYWISRQQKKQSDRILLPQVEESEKEYIRALVRKKAEEMLLLVGGEKPERVFVRFTKSRWGSCSSLKNISLNGYMFYLPNELFFYVLCHELTHLEHMNHSFFFWQALEKRLPNAKALEKRLQMYRLPL